MTMNETRIVLHRKLLDDCDAKHEVCELDFSPKQLKSQIFKTASF